MNTFLRSKLPNTGISIFTVMSMLSAEHHAINLGQGTPDFEISEVLIDLVDKAMKDGHNQYTHRNGLLVLREIIAEKIEFLYKNIVDPSQKLLLLREVPMQFIQL